MVVFFSKLFGYILPTGKNLRSNSASFPGRRKGTLKESGSITGTKEIEWEENSKDSSEISPDRQTRSESGLSSGTGSGGSAGSSRLNSRITGHFDRDEKEAADMLVSLGNSRSTTPAAASFASPNSTPIHLGQVAASPTAGLQSNVFTPIGHMPVYQQGITNVSPTIKECLVKPTQTIALPASQCDFPSFKPISRDSIINSLQGADVHIPEINTVIVRPSNDQILHHGFKELEQHRPALLQQALLAPSCSASLHSQHAAKGGNTSAMYSVLHNSPAIRQAGESVKNLDLTVLQTSDGEARSAFSISAAKGNISDYVVAYLMCK